MNFYLYLLRKHLSAPGLISTIHRQFSKIPDPHKFAKDVTISISDHLMSGLAVFGLKCPSLLDYDRKRSDDVIAQNLRALYLVNTPPSDTYLRERLDDINPEYIRPAFKRVFASFQRGKALEEFEYLDGHVLISGDGTGHFSSSNIACPQCCVKELQNGTKTYYHQFLFEQLETNFDTLYHESQTDDGYYHQFRFLNGASLNKSNPDVKVNFLEYRQTDLKGKELNFSWVTNIVISKTNAAKIAKGGRARWKIENETFNTLKNLGYNFEHNYGHGKKYLSTVLCLLMMLAFLVDQGQEICSSLFQRCRKFTGTYRYLWQTMRTLFHYVRDIL